MRYLKFLIACIVFLQMNALTYATDSIEEGNLPVIIAHRGASGSYPENTLVAYQKAIEAGADYLEIDLQMTQDGHLVTIHDQTVNDTTNGTGKVSSFSLNDLQKLDAGSWLDKQYKGVKIPTLAEVFRTFGNSAQYYIEVKKPNAYINMEEKLIEEIRNNKINLENIIIQSFELKSLEKIHKLEPSIKLVMLYWKKNKIPTNDCPKLKQLAYAVGMNHDRVTADMVKQVHEQGLRLHVYTANDDEEIDAALKSGVDGIFTNYPEKYNRDLLFMLFR
ncbi:glycerophosphodiester phosphodiesterase [Litchfieldia alkalitelluris]|uniref:glycerophosphodiester phosphodiesterase n=1 Tax=Litchfieldia alkalitelluris TaxID=304268 RepID=UPI001475D329|nr:glycerophosphodiester phosphodiesterase family protein [Litchfieldia alkalitelluris]